ncbi:hypothetical protein [Flagellimonas crocea]|uniref:hypothetical protein n=1 Tax=Flagellimonas crocea TaxID=3067311 RepID=UPI00296EAE03|nr:hypothetical protein [Muricauda sp. DH64]
MECLSGFCRTWVICTVNLSSVGNKELDEITEVGFYGKGEKMADGHPPALSLKHLVHCTVHSL